MVWCQKSFKMITFKSNEIGTVLMPLLNDRAEKNLLRFVANTSLVSVRIKRKQAQKMEP